MLDNVTNGKWLSRSRIPVYVGPEVKSPQSTTSNISTHSTQSNQSTVSTDSTGSSACTSSTTNIPMAVRQTRIKTQSSGSSTPLPPSTKLTRKLSGASDTLVPSHLQKKGKQTTQNEPKAPFRL